MAAVLPKAFVDRVRADSFLGEDLLDALETEAPVSIRFNPQKVRSSLNILSEVSWCKDAFYLAERPLFTLDPLFHA